MQFVIPHISEYVLVNTKVVIRYAHNKYDGRKRKIPSEDTWFYFRKRKRTAVSVTENDGA